MLDFYHRRFNVLVCTTIIESGIDVPTANTIIIDRADRFGLAQIHQLRGRVGRSHHRAYAYLITPPRQAMTADAVKRLEALESLEELGAGFTLATHDLEIRGAGELLGDEQSGQIAGNRLQPVHGTAGARRAALKSGKEPDLERPLDAGPEVELHVPALIPEDYVPDVHLRLVLYKRIASAPTREELRRTEGRNDRPLRSAARSLAQSLFRAASIKLRARRSASARSTPARSGGYVLFDEKNKVDPQAVIRLVQKSPRAFRLDGPLKLRFTWRAESEDERFSQVARLLESLTSGSGVATAKPAARSA